MVEIAWFKTPKNYGRVIDIGDLPKEVRSSLVNKNKVQIVGDENDVKSVLRLYSGQNVAAFLDSKIEVKTILVNLAMFIGFKDYPFNSEIILRAFVIPTKKKRRS